ncbi:MAG: type II toxin-antitoxin system RelE/ParE family toxin [Deltaproteobacteria bacterium]|nr:type II toxin-antitoxin system RelE/ParE family toxin [Deltaproteobacteria bacterium]
MSSRRSRNRSELLPISPANHRFRRPSPQGRSLGSTAVRFPVDDLKVPASNRLHKLERGREGQYSISVNDQWRICFTPMRPLAVEGKKLRLRF